MVEEILVGGEPLEPGGLYTVAMPDFVALMAPVYLNIELPDVIDLKVTMAEAVVDVVETTGIIEAEVEGRITMLR